MKRRSILLMVALGGVAAGVALVCSSGPGASLGAELAALPEASPTSLPLRLRRLLADKVAVRVGNAPPEVLTRDACVERAVALRRRQGPRVAEILSVETREEAGRIRLTGEVRLSESQVGDLHGERRRFEIEARIVEGRARVDRLELAAPEKHVPEFRP